MPKQKNENAASGSMKSIIGITAKLLIISMITALMLACVNALTKDTIDANIQAEKDAAIAALFPGEFESRLDSETNLDGVKELYMIYDGEEPVGYVAQVEPNGFGGELNVMVGVSRDGSVVGVKLISHSETPGLGSKVGGETHLGQYAGKTSVVLGTDINKVASATISSKALNKGVEAALAAYSTVFADSEVPNE